VIVDSKIDGGLTAHWLGDIPSLSFCVLSQRLSDLVQ
jgi:hypothetical protein